jgi:hypothetical protein
MGTRFKELMSKKSEEELMDYLINFNTYAPDAITAAVDELKGRGRNFTEQELIEIKEKIETSAKSEQEVDSLWSTDSLKINMVTDTNAPILYSKMAIRGFCVFFSTIFGAVLLSSNIGDTKNKLMVVGFGIIFTAFTIAVANIVPTSIYYVMILNTAGGLALTSTFWEKYVGKETKYRAKPIWKPLIISVIISIPFLLALIYGL